MRLIYASITPEVRSRSRSCEITQYDNLGRVAVDECSEIGEDDNTTDASMFRRTIIIKWSAGFITMERSHSRIYEHGVYWHEWRISLSPSSFTLPDMFASSLQDGSRNKTTTWRRRGPKEQPIRAHSVLPLWNPMKKNFAFLHRELLFEKKKKKREEKGKKKEKKKYPKGRKINKRIRR